MGSGGFPYGGGVELRYDGVRFVITGGLISLRIMVAEGFKNYQFNEKTGELIPEAKPLPPEEFEK
jgi:hypothetical protein